jgi:hypothetical protein
MGTEVPKDIQDDAHWRPQSDDQSALQQKKNKSSLVCLIRVNI